MPKKKMSDAVRRVLENTPRNLDFYAHTVAYESHPDAVYYDSEGRIMNRAIPSVARILNRTFGIIESKPSGARNGDPKCYWADNESIERQLSSNEWHYKER